MTLRSEVPIDRDRAYIRLPLARNKEASHGLVGLADRRDRTCGRSRVPRLVGDEEATRGQGRVNDDLPGAFHSPGHGVLGAR